MENWRKLSHNYHQILLLNNSSLVRKISLSKSKPNHDKSSLFKSKQHTCMPRSCGPCHAKTCLRTCTQCADSDHPAQSIIRAFALHSYGGCWVVRMCRVSLSPGRPIDIGLQLGKACYPWQVREEGGCFFLLFLHFHSCSSFFPVPLFYFLCYLFYLFSLPLGDCTK